MNIPDYELAQSRVANDKYSSLDWFLVENEPAGVVSTKKFRSELADVIAFVETETKIHCDEGFEKAIAEGEERYLNGLHWQKLADDIKTTGMLLGFFSGLIAASALWIGFWWLGHSRGG